MAAIEKDGPFFSITMFPEEGEVTPLMPFLQPGNYYTGIQGDRYRILRSMVDEYQRGPYGDEETYYSWTFLAERED